jgi:hypothetical protein
MPKDTLFIYHFCAIRQSKSGEITYYDGLVERREPLVSPLEYKDLKSAIAKTFDIPEKGLVIINLTRIPHA